MTSALHIVCPHSDSINRVPRTAARWRQARVLHRPFFERRPVGLNSVARFSRLPLLSASYYWDFNGSVVGALSGQKGDLKEQVP
jgi:hypothetical protein